MKSFIMFLLLLVCWITVRSQYPEAARRNLIPFTVSEIELPFLQTSPVIDANLDEWKDYSFHDGIWDIYRVSKSPWYRSSNNRLTDHGGEPDLGSDLQSRFYMGWDDRFLYFGAEVRDNVNDVEDPSHEPKRWYFKDCVCWFIEAPRDTLPESFKEGDNAFCFVIDQTYPEYGAWWRHGNITESYKEEPIPRAAVKYAIRMNPWGRSQGDYILEARIEHSQTLAKSTRNWTNPKVGDYYSMQIVQCDPDGGEYGGHIILYGSGDNDSTWGKVRLVGSKGILERKIK